jgi:hypothetical protein
MTSQAMRSCRPRDYVLAYGRKYPEAWRRADKIRAEFQGELPGWSYLPDRFGLYVLAPEATKSSEQLQGVSEEVKGDAAAISTLLTWRMTQGVYSFDPDVYEAVSSTSLKGDIPHEVLLRLPEWCVYVETPGATHSGIPQYGFFAHIDFEPRTERPMLALVLDTSDGLASIPVLLGAWPLAESAERTLAEARGQIAAGNVLATVSTIPDEIGAALAAFRASVEQPINLLLYLCSQAAEIGDGSRRPTNPEPKRVKRGVRLFAAEKPSHWDVGVRLGAALRLATRTAFGDGDGTGTGVRPHVRRAHWHGFWSGPRAPELEDQRRFELKWLPPALVNVDDVSKLPAVVRAVD